MLILQALLQFLNSYGEQIVYRGSGEGEKNSTKQQTYQEQGGG